MDGLKKDAIVYLFTKAGRCICGRYVGEGKCTNSSPTKSNTRRQIAGKRRT